MTHVDRTFDLNSLTDGRISAGRFQEVSHDGIFSRPEGSLYQRHGKRILDLALIIPALPILIPIVLIMLLVIACDGGFPIFGHRRIGKGGASFRCWKLRSMVVNAEKALADHLAQDPEAKREWDEHFKLERDPRITRFGNFLRRSSLDELPQLWNVLRGDMSLVGPRPVTAVELSRYGNNLPTYLCQKPGLTGKWQVNGRSAVSYVERVEMDAKYLSECSLRTDIGLIAATFLVVLRRTGK